MNYKWKLNDNHYSLIDRIKIATFVLCKHNRWTSGRRVMDLEDMWKKYTGYDYAIMTSSGSTAVELLALSLKHTTDIKYIVVPALTWSTSVMPWINLDIKPIFVDIDTNTLCMDITDLKRKISGLSKKEVYIFPTLTMGLSPPINTINDLGYPVCIDACEASFALPHLCNSSVTSFYFGHQFTTGTEGGMLFTNNKNLVKYAIQSRNHGMVRDLLKYHIDYDTRSKDVNPIYEFTTRGGNWRSNDLAAYMGLLDFKKAKFKKQQRDILTDIFYSILSSKYINYNIQNSTLFSLPIVSKYIDSNLLYKICKDHNVESRPIISGNLLRHKAFLKYGDYIEFPNADFIHRHGIYIGLHEGLTSKQVKKFAIALNKEVE